MQTTTNVPESTLITADLERRLVQAIEACDAACRQQKQAEARLNQSARRTRVLGGLAIAAVVGATALTTLKPVGAQGYGPTLTSLAARLLTVENKTQYMYTDSNARTSRFIGCNVLIQSGTGLTSDRVFPESTPTGLGNLIIGYNEPLQNGTDTYTGSHNLILGAGNSYTSFGGIVVGYGNRITNTYASVVGGSFNVASGPSSAITGGINGKATGANASVSGGAGGTASGNYSWAGGGFNNTVSGIYASVSGGNGCKASGGSASVLGGLGNEAYGAGSVVCGGYFANAGGNNSGGDYNTNLGGFGTSVTTKYGHNP